MKLFIATLLSLTVAGQAQALSCMRPDIVQSYKEHAEAAESYVVVRGKLRFTPPPRQPVTNDAEEQTIKARFEGVALSGKAFDTSYSRPLTLVLSCAGPWCGSITPDTEVIAFVEQSEDGLVLNEGPCPFRIFYEPTREQVDRLLYCHTRGICE